MTNNFRKEVFRCPSCSHKVRIPKYKKIIFTCPNCKMQINHDGRVNRKPYYIGAILLILIIFYIVFFQDYLAYLEVQKERTKAVCIEYYDSFPNGFFTEEVQFIEILVTKDIEIVRMFLDNYPNSDKLSEVLTVNENLWEFEINRYNEIVKGKKNLDTQAVTFFRTMLEYMRDNNESAITLILKGNVKVKNFERYDNIIKAKLDSAFFSRDTRKVSENIIDIETNYSQGIIKDYENIVKGVIETGFENILSHNFISIVPHNHKKSNLTIVVNYDIKNQDDAGYPVIWTYAKGSLKEDFISYLIGISITYSFEMKLPTSNENFNFDYKTNALDNINNVSSIEEGYQRMTSQNFYYFSELISTKFGLYEEQNLIEHKK